MARTTLYETSALENIINLKHEPTRFAAKKVEKKLQRLQLHGLYRSVLTMNDPIISIDKYPIFKNAIEGIDHITYVAKYDNAPIFIEQWKAIGFTELSDRLYTTRYPAVHIGLAIFDENERNGDHKSKFNWKTMTGLSISEDPNSPINEFISRYGEGVPQHIAYKLSHKVDIDELYKLMEKKFDIMTPLVSFDIDEKKLLSQFFLAPKVPFGPFIEFIQRHDIDNTYDEKIHKAFTDSFDQTYYHYEKISKKLEGLHA